MFDIVFSLNGSANIFISLKVDEALQPMPFRKSVNISRTMLKYSAHKVIGHADVQNSVGSIGQDVDIAAIAHVAIMKGVDGRDKPGHDEIHS